MMLQKLGLRTRVFLIFAALAFGILAALFAGLAVGYRRLGSPVSIDAFVQVGVIAGFVGLGLVAWVWYLFDINVARPIDVLAGALRARAHADVSNDFDAAVARYLGDLAPAATAAATSLHETRNALAEAVARETLRLGEEKARLEALLSDVPVGVLLCSGDHQIVFYNSAAFDALAVVAGVHLDRRLTDYLREGPILMAHGRLVASNDADAASDLMCTTVAGARVLAARMRLLPEDRGERPGYVLTLRDVTTEVSTHARTDAFLSELLDRVRRPAANLNMLIAAMPEQDGAIDTAFRSEVAALSATVTDLAARHDAGRVEGWPLDVTRASDLVDGLDARLMQHGIGVQSQADDLLLRCNGFEILALLDGLALNLQAAGLASPVTVSVTEEDTGAMIRLTWTGKALAVGTLERWLKEPLEADRPEATRAAVLAAHATEIWPESGIGGTAALCLPIRQARRAAGQIRPITRRVVYDFDLLSRARGARVADTRLDALTCVVFDTETTGLLPRQGDEIVQIAAMRIVNGRLVEGEVFDTLVNPGRGIPLSSTEVHGITEAMVTDAPDVVTALKAFHRFAEGAVLVAHNAPFDMEFLRRHEKTLGLRFDHPVLDTVLLSAVVFGQHEAHSLDALTHRLGITIPVEARHTAIGDTRATAEVFLRLLPVLKGRALETFGDVLREVRRHGRLLADLNTDEQL